jgi:hypothetical protein
MMDWVVRFYEGDFQIDSCVIINRTEHEAEDEAMGECKRHQCLYEGEIDFTCMEIGSDLGDDDECPNCCCGTIEVVDGWIKCRGECGQNWEMSQ